MQILKLEVHIRHKFIIVKIAFESTTDTLAKAFQTETMDVIMQRVSKKFIDDRKSKQPQRSVSNRRGTCIGIASPKVNLVTAGSSVVFQGIDWVGQAHVRHDVP
jgi:hypothetical protein